MDEKPNSTTDTTTKATLTVGLLLFASVILGAGALGEDGRSNSTDSDERGSTDDAREDTRTNDDMDLDLDRLGTACESGDEEACRQLEMVRVNRGDGGQDRPEMDVRDWDRERGPEEIDRDRRGGMGIDPEILVEMAEMWCHDHVYSTFWENTGEVYEGEEGFEIITYDEEGNTEGTFISHDAMSQLLIGLEPLVESCTEMMLMQMGVPDEWDGEWDDEDESDEWDDEDESDEEDDVPCNTPDCDDGDEDETDESQD